MLQAVSPKQLDFLRGSNRKVNILEGSIRSGKTIIALVRWMMFVATAPKTGALVMVGRTRDSVWRNMIGPLQDPTLFGGLVDDVIGNYGAPTVKIFGRLVHVLGASDAKSEKVLRGLTVAGAMVDEITTIPEEFFTQLLGRMSVQGAQLFGTTNPDGPAHWFKKKFLDRIGQGKGKLPHWTRWRFTMDDNPSLSPEYIAEKKLEFTGLFYKRFIEGLWVAAEGAVFDFWDEAEHVVAWKDLPPMQRYFGCGIDYGTTHATSAIILGLGIDGVLYFVDEWRYEAADRSMRLNDATITTAIKEWLPVEHIPHPTTLQPEWVIIDPAAASLHVEFGTQGVRNVIPANNEVLYGIRTMSSLMANGKLKVSDRCQGLISEMPGYSWDPAASLRGEDKPIKTADDSIDPARYVVATTETNWRGLVDLAA